MKYLELPYAMALLSIFYNGIHFYMLKNNWFSFLLNVPTTKGVTTLTNTKSHKAGYKNLCLRNKSKNYEQINVVNPKGVAQIEQF